MKNYTLTLITGQTTDFTVSLNGSALTTTEFANTFIEAAGSAQFTFDTASTGFTIWDSSAMDGKSISGTATVTTTDAYEGTWAANSGQTTNTFTAFAKAEGVAMTKFQISDLMSRVKNAKDIIELEFTDQVTSLQVKDIYDTYGSGYFKIVNNSTANGNRTVYVGPGNTTNANIGVLRYPGDVMPLVIGEKGGDVYTVSMLNVNAPMLYFSHYATITNPSVSSLYPSVVTSLTSASQYNPLAASAGRNLNRKIIGNDNGDTALAWTTIGTASAYTKRALQVTVNISETSLTLTADEWNTLFTLPTNFIPTIAMEGTVSVLDSGVIETSYVKVNTDGTVQVRAFGSTTEVHGSIVFPVSS